VPVSDLKPNNAGEDIPSGRACAEHAMRPTLLDAGDERPFLASDTRHATRIAWIWAQML
jgi:hypothetical protein